MICRHTLELAPDDELSSADHVIGGEVGSDGEFKSHLIGRFGKILGDELARMAMAEAIPAGNKHKTSHTVKSSSSKFSQNPVSKGLTLKSGEVISLPSLSDTWVIANDGKDFNFDEDELSKTYTVFDNQKIAHLQRNLARSHGENLEAMVLFGLAVPTSTTTDSDESDLNNFNNITNSRPVNRLLDRVEAKFKTATGQENVGGSRKWGNQRLPDIVSQVKKHEPIMMMKK